MVITAGPISLARPEWGLQRGTVTSLTANDSGGYPEVLAAQMLCGAAISGVRVLMLLPGLREEDEVWRAVIKLLADGDARSACRTLGSLPLTVHTCGMGWDKIEQAHLVYAPGLTHRQINSFGENAPAVLVVGKDFDGRPAARVRHETIHVGRDVLVINSEGFEVPVEYDPSGPIYRPA